MTKDNGAPAAQDGLSQAEPEVSALRASIPSGGALRKVAAQIRHRLSDMELRSNVSWPASSPAAKTSGYVISEVADWQLRQWLGIIENTAQDVESINERYGQLIYSVARKYEGESRHETALRYIREREDMRGDEYAASVGEAPGDDR